MQADGKVTIWAMALHAVSDRQWALLADVLSDAERERAAFFSFDRHRREYAAAHALKRLLLTAAVSGTVKPSAWTFETGLHGKPVVAAGRGPHFNLSHCEGLVACAVCHAVEVGIDVECLHRPAPFELVDSHFAASERLWLESLPTAQRSAAIFKLWTLKEAYIKATGLGLTQRLDSFAFAFDPLRVMFANEALGDAGSWRFDQRVLDTRSHVLAAAWRSGATEISADVKLVSAEELLR